MDIVNSNICCVCECVEVLSSSHSSATQIYSVDQCWRFVTLSICCLINFSFDFLFAVFVFYFQLQHFINLLAYIPVISYTDTTHDFCLSSFLRAECSYQLTLGLLDKEVHGRQTKLVQMSYQSIKFVSFYMLQVNQSAQWQRLGRLFTFTVRNVNRINVGKNYFVH